MGRTCAWHCARDCKAIGPKAPQAVYEGGQ